MSSLSNLLRSCADQLDQNDLSKIDQRQFYRALSELHQLVDTFDNANDQNGATSRRGSAKGGNSEDTQAAAIKAARNAFESVRLNGSQNNNSVLPNVFEDIKPKSSRRPEQQSQDGGVKTIGSLFKSLKVPSLGSNGSADQDNRPNYSSDWCDEHFTMGCQCKNRATKRQQQQTATAKQGGRISPRDQSPTQQPSKNISSMTHSDKPAPSTSAPSRPQQQSALTHLKAKKTVIEVSSSFQRPANPKSNILATGQVEQQRRSMMILTWKAVQITLVGASKNNKSGAGDEPIFWVQKRVNDPSGFPELQELHRIPVAWIEHSKPLSGEGYRFCVKVYGSNDELLFRCSDEEGMMNWVATLVSVKESLTGFSREEKHSSHSQKPAPQKSVSVATQNQPQPKQVSSQRPNGEQYSNPTSATEQRPTPSPVVNSQPQKVENESGNDMNNDKPKLTIRELRAYANGEGIDTRGMERSDLERIHESILARMPPPPPKNTSATNIPPIQTAPSQEDLAEKARQQQMADAQRKHAEELERRKRQEEEDAKIRRQQAEQKRLEQERVRLEQRKAEQKAAEERRRQQYQQFQADQKAAEQRAAEERLRQQMAAQQASAAQAAAARKAEEERRRQQAAAEQIRQQQQQQQQEAARRQAEAQRQWQQEQARQYYQQQQAPNPTQQQNNQQHPKFYTGHHQQNQQPQQHYQQQYRPQPQPGPPPPHQNPGSPRVQAKYAHAMENEDAQQEAITAIKRAMLINWALLPPAMHSLRPIDQLISTIHAAFPPAFGVTGHAYFKKWKVIQINDLRMGSSIDEKKLEKAVKKVKFFLHPDKLPRDLNDEQSFACKMLWDVVADADEDYRTRKEQLDWIK